LAFEGTKHQRKQAAAAHSCRTARARHRRPYRIETQAGRGLGGDGQASPTREQLVTRRRWGLSHPIEQRARPIRLDPVIAPETAPQPSGQRIRHAQTARRPEMRFLREKPIVAGPGCRDRRPVQWPILWPKPAAHKGKTARPAARAHGGPAQPDGRGSRGRCGKDQGGGPEQVAQL